MDLIPVSFTIEKKCNELSNKDSLIFTDNNKTYITYNNTIYQWNTSSLSQNITLPHKITAILNLSIIGFENGIVKINDTFHKISTKKITCIGQNDQKIYFSSNNELVIYDLVQEKFDRITLQCHINTFCVNDFIVLGCADKTVKIYKEKLLFEIALMEDVKQVFLLNFLYIFTKNKVIKVNLDTKKEETYTIKEIIKAIYTDTFYILTKEGIFTLKERIYKKKLDFFNFNFIEDTFVFLGRNEICYKKNDSSSHLKRFYFHESKIIHLKHFKNLFTMSHFSVIEWENKEIKNVFEFDDQIFDFCLLNDILYVLKENCVEGVGVLDREIKFKSEIKANSFAVTNNFFCYSEKCLLKICANKSELETFKEFDLKDDIDFIKVSEDEKYLAAVTGNVVHVILLPKKKILTLYGHSLPITDTIFYNEKVFTYGMDKTVKVFGLDFGEVIKSISLKDAGNKGKLAVFDDHNWLLASNNLIHFEKFDLKNIYKEKCHLISILKEELVISDGKSILFMKEGDFYEPEIQFNQIVKEEELINQNEFDKFITNLEGNNLNLDINLGELEKYVEILNTSQIKLLINQLKSINNLVMKVRVINLLYKLHREILLGNVVFETEMNDTFEKFRVLRKSVNRSYYLKKE